MALFLEIKSDEAAASRIRLSPGRNRITVRPGDSYQIVDDQTGFAPPGTTVKRVDSAIVIDGLGKGATGAGETGENVVVDLDEFYTTCSVSSPCSVVLQKEAGGAITTVTPSTQPIGALADGSFVLYDPGYVAPEPVAVEPSDGGWGRMALYGLGGLAVVGLAVGGGSSGGGGDGGAPPLDPTLRLASSATVNSTRPLISGQGEPGATITVQLDFDRNNVSDARYQTTVAADGHWSVDLATATPTQGALPAAGIGESSSVLVTSNLAGKVASLGPFDLVFDGVPPAPAVIAAIATDNAVNGPEKQAGVTISGTSEPNGSVLVGWGTVQKPASVDAAGKWAVSFTSAEVPADGATVVSAIARDAAGNSASATTQAVSVESAPPALAIAAVATDNQVNAAEAANVVVSGTTAPGAAVNVGWNGVVKPVTAAANGSWSVSFAGAEVPAPAAATGAVFPLTVTATSVIGNVASAAPVSILVDRVAPTPPAIAPVEGDNVVTLAEAADGVVISGTGEPGATVNLNWAGTNKTAAVAAGGAWNVAFGVNEIPGAPAGGGATALSATQTDSAGNVGAPSALSVTVVQPLPAPTVATTIAGDGIVNAAEAAAGFIISGTVTAGAPGVTVAISGVAGLGTATITGATWSYTVPGGTALGQGAHTVTATIAEPGGRSGTGSFSVDTVGPAAPTIAPVTADGIVNIAEFQSVVPITGTAEPGATVTLALGTAPAQAAVANTAGSWSVGYTAATLPVLPPGGGTANLLVTTADAIGNAGASKTAVVTFDLAAPAAPVVVANSATLVGGTLTVTGTAEANSVVSVSVNPIGGAPTLVTAGITGAWTATFSTALASGTFTATAIATDAAGNAGLAGVSTHIVNPPVALDGAPGDGLSALTLSALHMTVGDEAYHGATQAPHASVGSLTVLAVERALNPESIFTSASTSDPHPIEAPMAIGIQSPVDFVNTLLWHPSS